KWLQHVDDSSAPGRDRKWSLGARRVSQGRMLHRSNVAHCGEAFTYNQRLKRRAVCCRCICSHCLRGVGRYERRAERDDVYFDVVYVEASLLPFSTGEEVKTETVDL